MTLGQYRRFLSALDLTDMGVSTALLKYHPVTPGDIVAAASALPQRERRAVMNLIFDLAGINQP